MPHDSIMHEIYDFIESSDEMRIGTLSRRAGDIYFDLPNNDALRVISENGHVFVDVVFYKNGDVDKTRRLRRQEFALWDAPRVCGFLLGFVLGYDRGRDYY